MATTIQQVMQDLDKVAIFEDSVNGKSGMKFCKVTYEGGPLMIRLSEDLNTVKSPSHLLSSTATVARCENPSSTPSPKMFMSLSLTV